MYFEQGKFDAAEPLYRRALKITEKALGPDHVDVGGMFGNLGILHAAAGNYNQAMPLFERTAESAVASARTGLVIAIGTTAIR